MPLLVQNFGDGLTCLIALPLAVFAFKMKRESIGLTYANSREPGIALIEGKYRLHLSHCVRMTPH